MLDADRQRRRQEARRAGSARYKARLKSGRACYLAEADAEVLYLLVKLHWIEERELTNKTAVESALGEMLRAAAELERLADAAR